MPTLQQKYDFLCQQLIIKHVDLWEQDAQLELKNPIYFQFNELPENIDDALEKAFNT